MEFINQLKRVTNKIKSVFVSPLFKNFSTHKKFFATVGTASILLFGATSYVKNNFSESVSSKDDDAIENLGCLPITEPTVKYNFALDTFHCIEDRIKHNDVFSSMLVKRGMKYVVADSLVKKIKPLCDLEKIQDGKPYTVLMRNPKTGYDYLIYEPDAKRYIIVDLKNHAINEVKRKVEVKEFEAAGKINDNLWESMVENGFSYALTDMVEDALKYQVDLRKFKKDDTYKLIWEEEFVDSVSVGVKCLKAAYFKQKNETNPFYAIHFEAEKERGWYSKEGNPMKDGFLKSPLKYSRITSHYSQNRFHPILGYNRPHFGTDYGAPTGTPILAVAEGKVTDAHFTSGNGNYVKIKHAAPYESQYLHMSRFAKGIKPGTHVKQGEVIGYVGSTGLATGPHVCFRFWKNGVQVDHLKEKLPTISIFSDKEKKAFKETSTPLMARLDKIPFLSVEEVIKRKLMYLAMRGKP